MPIPILTEAALGAIAKAVFGHVVKQTVETALPADKVRAWLGRDPQQLAFQGALCRAYTVFARHYPEWTVSLFDEPFLKGPAAPFLAHSLSRNMPPDPAGLCCKKWQRKKLGMLVPHHRSYTATLNSVATSATCPLTSPFGTPCSCPFLIMFITSYPCNVRQAVSNEKKPIPGFVSRLMKR